MRDWENQLCSIGNLVLNSIMNQAKEVKDPFGSISFTHVYREFNTQAIFLSKESLIMYEGTLPFYLCTEEALKFQNQSKNFSLHVKA